MNSIVYNMDCMEGMKQYPDKYFDLAVVDPPYGIGADKKNSVNKIQSKNSACKSINYGAQNWDDSTPTDDYFIELKRVSKHQIIWGVNYYQVSFLNGGRIYWDKCVTMPTYSDGEIAYCSMINSIKSVRVAWHGMIQQDMKNKEHRIHPTQKPVALYDWIYKNYLPNGGKVLDTHGGSMSNLIAALKAGNIEMHVYEIDKDYFKDAKQRVELFQSQGNLFAESQKIEWISF